MSKLDVSAEVAAICEKAGLKPGDVAEITILPAHMTVRAFQLDSQGRKFVEGPSETVAVRRYEFDVQT